MTNARAAIEQMSSGQMGQPAACMIESNMALSVERRRSCRRGRADYGVLSARVRIAHAVRVTYRTAASFRCAPRIASPTSGKLCGQPTPALRRRGPERSLRPFLPENQARKKPSGSTTCLVSLCLARAERSATPISARLWSCRPAPTVAASMGELSNERPWARVWSVGALVNAVAGLLEQGFPACTVSGEIAGFSRAASGHCYFTLKDANGSASLRCAMFRRAASLLDFTPADGQRVELRGRLGVYEPRGELQFIAEAMRSAGAGALYERFLRLRARLEAEGLFDPAAKRPLPPHPRAIGIVTSLAGAALHDVATTLARRSPHVARRRLSERRPGDRRAGCALRGDPTRRRAA